MHFATPVLLGAPTLARDTPALPALQDSPSFPPSLYHQTSRERRLSKERLCNRLFFSPAKRCVARHGERGAVRIGNLVRFSRQSQQVLLVREEEEWRTGPVQGSSIMKRRAWAETSPNRLPNALVLSSPVRERRRPANMV